MTEKIPGVLVVGLLVKKIATNGTMSPNGTMPPFLCRRVMPGRATSPLLAFQHLLMHISHLMHAHYGTHLCLESVSSANDSILDGFLGVMNCYQYRV
jgi:hypothetical protein